MKSLAFLIPPQPQTRQGKKTIETKLRALQSAAKLATMGSSKSPSTKPSAKKASKPSTKSKAKTQLTASTTKLVASPKPPSISSICIIDNGGWKVKYGLIPTNGTIHDIHSSEMLNCTARPPHQLAVLTGDEIHHMKNLGQLSFSHSLERGMIVDGSTQCAVWSRVLNVCGVNVVSTMNKAGVKRVLPTNVASNNVMIVLLEPPFVPAVISEGVDKILFRELGVGRVVKVLGGCMAAIKYLEEGRENSDNEKIQIDNTVAEGVEDKWINDDTKCCCIIDSGYSFTHVIPTQSGVAIEIAIRRLDIGGKVLTNLLKEAVTYRQWNMMDEYHVVNDAKEQLCFISQDFNQDMKHARQTRRGLRHFDREFLLPDFVNTFKGTVQLPMPLQRMRELEEDKKKQLAMETEKTTRRESKASKANSSQSSKDTTNNSNEANNDLQQKKKQKRRTHEVKNANDVDHDDMSAGDSDEESEQQRLERLKQMRDQEQKRREAEAKDRQALALSVERFTVPEVLFCPSDLGLECDGIAEAIVESINACDATLHAAMYHNVVLVGGNAKIPGFKERIEMELRKLAPTNYAVRVFLPKDPISYAWEGAKQFSKQPGFQERFSIDRLQWESSKKAVKNQQQIWGDRLLNELHTRT